MKRAALSVEWLRSARCERCWTQEELAEKVDVDVTTVQRWERGKSRPQPHTYRQLEMLFGRGPQLEQATDTSFVISQQTTLKQLEIKQALVVATSPVAVVKDSYTHFAASDLGTRLDRILRTWSICRGNARYHELQSLIIREVEQKDNTMQENPINRRNALRRLASVPIELWGFTLVAPAVLKPFPFEEILNQCAAGITALWYLRQGKDLAFAHDAVSRYIPTLEAMVASSTGQQHKEAAELLAQSLLLKATCVNHTNADHTAALRYAEQAETYSDLAGNLTLAIVAIRKQATAYDYADNWKQAMYTANKAIQLIETADAKRTPLLPMLQSYVYAGLANYQAHSGPKYKQEALSSLGQAQTTFDAVRNDAAPIWMDYSESSLLIHIGLAYYHLGASQKAIDSFARIDQLPIVMETQRVESFTDQVMTEVNREDKSRDMEFCITRWKQGIQGAIAIRSEQSFTEAKMAYAAMRGAWPTEPRIKALSDYIQHW